jgi:membrane protein
MSKQHNRRRPTIGRLGKMVFMSIKDLFRDDGPQWSAAIAYYALLSIFPLLLAVAAVSAYFVDPKWTIQQITQLLGRYLPTGQAQRQQVAGTAISARRTIIGLASFVVLLWSGSRVFGVITKALNVAYDIEDSYGFLKRTLVQVMLLVTIGFAFVLAVASRWLIQLAWNVLLGVAAGQGIIAQVIGNIVAAVLLLTAFFLIYHFIPRAEQSWQASVSGAVVATLLFLLAQPLFTTYIRHFTNLNLIYGPIAALVTVLLWVWVVSLILLNGGEIASHVQRMLIKGMTAAQVQQRY